MDQAPQELTQHPPSHHQPHLSHQPSQPHSTNHSPQQQMQLDILVHPKLPLCRQHGMALTHFCMTCLDMICSDCYRAHTHSNFLHKILTLEDAKNSFCSYLNQLVEKANRLRLELLNKTDTLLQQEDHVKKVARTIEIDIFVETEGLLTRLQTANKKQLGPLTTELVRLQKLANLITDAVTAFKELENDKVRFLSGYIHLFQSFTKIRLSPVERPPQRIALPNQIAEMQVKKLRISRLQEWSTYLDQVIHQTLQSSKEAIEQAKKERDEKGRMPLPRQLQVVRKFQVICVFCGEYLAQRIVNQSCIGNGSYQQNRYGHISEELAKNLRGTRKHYWGQSFVKIEYGKMPALGRSLSKQEYYMAGIKVARDVALKIRYKLDWDHKSIKDIIPEHIDEVGFVYKMRKFIQLDTFDLEFLFSYLKEEEVLAREVLDGFIRDPNALLLEQRTRFESKYKSVAPKSIASVLPKK